MNESVYTPLKDGGLTLLIDTDIGPDCDDAGALAVAASMAKRYGVPVGAVVSCTSSPYGAPCAEAICRFCGLEVGAFAENKQEGLLSRENNMRYNREIAGRFCSPKTYEDAVTAYRRTLAALPDGGAVVVGIGPFATLAQLMRSRPDEFSPLCGKDLFAKKVRAAVVMAAKYPKGREYNIICDPPSAIGFFDACEVPIFFADFDAGYSVRSGFPRTVSPRTDNPLYLAYLRYCTDGDYTCAQLNASYDLVAMHFAFEGDSEWFGISEPYRFTVTDEGENTFIPDPAGRCYRILKRATDEALGAYYSKILSAAGKDERAATGHSVP